MPPSAERSILRSILGKSKLSESRRELHVGRIGRNCSNGIDIVGERKRTNYRVDSNSHWMDETFEIRVRNHKNEAATVRVVEHLYRWTNWKLTEQSQQFKKRDAQTIEFPVTVAPDGEQVVTYTVHYWW